VWAIVATSVLFVLLCVGGGVFFLPRLLETPRGEQPVEPMGAGSLVGPEGGEVAGPGGARVVIPERALAEEVSIDIAEVPSAQGAPPDMAPAGPAYQVTIPEDARLLTALDVVLPLEREAGSKDDSYAVYRWDGSQWQFLGGFVEGDFIRVQIGQHLLARAPVPVAKGQRAIVPVDQAQDSPAFLRAFRELSTGRYRTIAFVNQGEFSPWILPWTYEAEQWAGTIRLLPAYGGWSGGKPGEPYFPYSWAWMRLPFGTYTSWCIEWWDHDEKDYFHFILDSPVTLNLSTCTRDEQDRGECEVPRVDYSLPSAGGGEQGLCGRPPGGDEALPAPTLVPTSTSGPSTTAPTATLPASAPAPAPPTPAPPTPTATPAETPTSTPEKNDIVVTLIWYTKANLDLSVVDPLGNGISSLEPPSPEGGHLHQDVNKDCATATTTPSEIISWPAGSAPYGDYRVGVFDFTLGSCQADATDFRIVVEVDGEITLDTEGTVYATGMVPLYDFTR
jgi:hypothetical protein